MAVFHSADRASTVQPATGERKLRPAIGLLGGFGFIVGAALLAHFAFNALI